MNQEQREAIIRNGGGLVDLWEHRRSANRGQRIAHRRNHRPRFFRGTRCCAAAKAIRILTLVPRGMAREIDALQLIVPCPMTARSGLTQEGKQSPHALSITGQRWFLVVEFDQGDVDDHAALLWHLALKAPLAMVVHSGSKSLHGWFFCAGQPEERLRQVMRYCVSLGADRATWSRSQFVRMPDGLRDNGKRQVVYYFNPEVIK